MPFILKSYRWHFVIFCSLLTRYLEIVHPIWHKTHFKKKWLYICFAIIWPFGIVFNSAVWIPVTKVIQNWLFTAIGYFLVLICVIHNKESSEVLVIYTVYFTSAFPLQISRVVKFGVKSADFKYCVQMWVCFIGKRIVVLMMGDKVLWLPDKFSCLTEHILGKKYTV